MVVASDLNKQIRFVEADIVFVLKLFLAFILIVVGIVGIIFPIVPDWPLIIVGIVLLDTRGKARNKMISWLPERYREKAHKILFFKFARKKVK